MLSVPMRRILYPAYRRLETIVHPLRYLFIELTQRCNLACRHCGSDCGRSPNLDELSTDEWLAFFAYLPRHFDAQRMMLILTGGEPTCHPEFERLLEGIRHNGLSWALVTNGWSLDSRLLELILRNGVACATVSLDGTEQSHDWLRGRTGSFQRAVRAIRGLASQTLVPFDVVTCVHPGNLTELSRIGDLLRELGVPAWRLFAIAPKGRAKWRSDLELDVAGWQAMFDFIARERMGSRDLRINFSCEGYLPSALEQQLRDEPYFCRAGIAIGSVLCDGAIAACPNISRSLIQGNIRSDDFAEIWAKRYQPYRERSWLQRGACTHCEQWRRCQGNSLHLWDPELGETSRCIFRELAASELRNPV